MQYIIKCTLFQEQRELSRELKKNKGDKRNRSKGASQTCSSQGDHATTESKVRINIYNYYELICIVYDMFQSIKQYQWLRPQPIAANAAIGGLERATPLPNIYVYYILMTCILVLQKNLLKFYINPPIFCKSYTFSVNNQLPTLQLPNIQIIFI